MPIWHEARLTGYHPKDVSTKAESSLEGKDVDSVGMPLHYFEMYDKADPSSFVGLSADNTVFKYGDKIEILEFPNVRFIVRDNGGRFNNKTKGSAFDVPVLTKEKAKSITQNIHWRRSTNNFTNTVSHNSFHESTKSSDALILGVLILALFSIKKGIRL